MAIGEWVRSRREERECEAKLVEKLMRNGQEIGFIIRFWSDGPTYAWTAIERIAACTTDDAAREAVEGRFR